MKSKYLLTILLLCLGSAGLAQLKLPAVISNNMIIQRNSRAPIWGWAAAGEKITVTFRDKTYTAQTGSDGKWMLQLDATKAGGPFEMTVNGNGSTIKLSNIWAGDVWIASGQSNMEFGIQTDSLAEESIAAATDSLIHFFVVPMTPSLQLQKDIAAVPGTSLNGQWVVCSPQLMASENWAWHGFSAVGYYFAKEIRKATGSPVGMIGTYKGGTPAQAWISIDGLQQSPAFTEYVSAHQLLLSNYDNALAAYPAKQAAFREELKQWNKASGKPRPREPMQPNGGFNAPSNLYNAMIAPLVPYAIKGVIWYQGESNGDRLNNAVEYATLFPRLINNWRAKWNQGNFPFLYVQLANFRAPAKTPAEGNWAWVREAQLKALQLPNTGMAVITDVGNAGNIHPTDKLDVGVRLALAARKVAYHEKLVYSGPMYRSMRIKGSDAVIRFTETGSGLAAGRHGGGGALQGFGIAGSDGKFVWAQARIEGNTVVVHSDEVPHPVSVRYNWADNPPGNLYNKEGLPASGFRTDK